MPGRLITNLVLLLCIFTSTGCSSQEPGSHAPKQLYNRKPAVAGQFYPADSLELHKTLEKYFSHCVNKNIPGVRALISPHAGYVFSGEVAASSFCTVDTETKFDRIFVIGSSHRTYFEGASVYVAGNYITPLGEVPVDIGLCEKLIEENKSIVYNAGAHISEHSIEVQLPFIQYHLKEGYKIVPIVIGSQNEKFCKELAGILKPFFNERNLFVISTDFSHYPGYDDSRALDKQAADAIVSNSPPAFLKVITEKKNEDVDGLATRCCGWTSVLTLLNLTQSLPGIEYRSLMYKNSGDTSYGDKNRVVGYNSIIVVQTGVEVGNGFELNNKDKEVLLGLARKTIEEYIAEGMVADLSPEQFPENTHINCGAFVTLHENGNLRGCIGRFTADIPLYSVIQQMAIASSTKDTRFMPVTVSEIPSLEIEISVLTPMKRIGSVDEIELGKHGIYIIKGNRSGTFLPQVATETGWSKEEFLGHCARDKAGIGWDGWKDAEIYIYEALVFSEKDFE